MKGSKNIIFVLFFIAFVIVVYFLVKNLDISSTQQQPNKLHVLGNTTFVSSSKYADVEYNTSSDSNTLYITVNYKDLTGVSAIHIHVNNNGSPGPVLAWLGTTAEWQSGVAQNTPGGNSPCCNIINKLCTLAAPDNTPNITELSNTTMTFTVKNPLCNKSCPWINNGTLLDVHGFNFQKVIDGNLTSEPPGADIISNTVFTSKNKK
jgi:hypothetical protein